MTFNYTPLNDQEIRLVTIYPNKNSKAIIECSLEVVSLRQRPKFEALSYVWGSIDTFETIRLDKQSFEVTPNLGSALRHLRQPTDERVMWIDYICINQEDVPEKNKQVPLMGSIYMTAIRVVSILGEYSPEIEMAVSWCERYIHKRATKRTLFWRKLELKELWSVEARREKEIAILKTFIGLRHFILLPYWTRMWTFQEYQLPEREPICMCGAFTFKASAIMGTTWDGAVLTPFAAMDRLGQDPVEIERKNKPSPDQDEKTKQHCLEVQRLSAIDDGEFARIMERFAYFDIVRDRDAPAYKGLASLIYLAYHRQCGNPRDRVYALYALVPSAQEAYPPDYNKPLEQVLVETTEFIIRKETRACIFNLFAVRDNHLLDDTIPSWVPDYTTPCTRVKGLSSHYISRNIKESLWTPAVEYFPHVSEDYKTLHLWGRTVGHCKPIFRFGSDLRKVVADIMQVVEMLEAWRTIWDPLTVRARFVEACLCHFPQDDTFTIEDAMEAIQNLAHTYKNTQVQGQSNETDAAGNDKFQSKLRKVLSANCNQSVFLLVTKAAQGFGICPVTIEDEDIVVVANTAEQPLVLRRQLDTGHKQAWYKLVGQTYVDGLAETSSSLESPLYTMVKDQSHEEFHII
ncbi:heterokaryon incompatibility protein-domain-containing protein [Aspergillus pseudotamarii]|uniref:Heterokaryon incompatibility protein-domain-containing protein n=1 Tax=Aspergillus pseudotamarii TaxID=132259 RepID=A0A5N6TC80_ASPPS|nr:heterokaryon incompatibility protein-domain-containing protein [Aspergillus pseudotamarii]KAE8143769.1 heterokaryon incompatibility protein-domain-containing protein [Aspergillus pseudotamarii]